MLSVFSFRLRVLAGGEDLVATEMVPPIHMYTCVHLCTCEMSAVVCVLVGEGLGSKTPLIIPLCFLRGASC